MNSPGEDGIAKRGDIEAWISGMERGIWNPTAAMKRQVALVLRKFLESPRVAVVRPTRPDSATAMRDEIAAVLASWESWDDETRRMGGPLADLIADNLDVWNGFGAPAVVRPTRDPWDDDAVNDFVNAILEHSPDTWDGDEGASAIAEDFVGHAVDEVKRLGGCLHRWCAWSEDEPCDHGYLPEKVSRDERRGQIMDIVVETRGRWSLLQDDIESRVPMPEFDQMVAEALLDAFAVAVSDSQETPTL